MGLFEALKPQGLDPIMAGFMAFGADPRPEKINLGVGMYYNERGEIPVMDVVRAAQAIVAPTIRSYAYLQPDGLPALREATKRLVFGEAMVASDGARIVTVQTLGGTGALKVGADVIARIAPGSTVAMSRPTWGNHPAIFGGAGLTVTEYPYYDAATGLVDWPGMRDAVAQMAAGTVVLLHACCHNPTGADLTPENWVELAGLIKERGLVPFLDMAYAGFAEGLEADSAPARLLAQAGGPVFVATSFSKSFALYAERVGALSVVAASADQAKLVLDQVKVAGAGELLDAAVHRGAAGGRGADQPGVARAVGGRAGHHARADQADADRAGGAAGGQQQAGFQPVRGPEGAVLLLGAGARTDAAAAGRVRHLRGERRAVLHVGVDRGVAGPGGGGHPRGGLSSAGRARQCPASFGMVAEERRTRSRMPAAMTRAASRTRAQAP